MDDPTRLPILGFAPTDIPKMTNGVISRTRVFEDLAKGRLRAKKVGKRDIITTEEARRYIEAFPDRPARKPGAA